MELFGIGCVPFVGDFRRLFGSLDQENQQAAEQSSHPSCQLLILFDRNTSSNSVS
jgi:hypothetical protein